MRRLQGNGRNLVFADNEGCIIEAKGKDFDLAALSQLKAILTKTDKFIFSICTGRSVPYVEAMTQVLGLHNSPCPCVCEGGAVLYWPAEDRVQPLVDPLPSAELLKKLPVKSLRVEPGKTCCLSLYPTSGLTVSQLTTMVTPLINTELYTLRTSVAAVDITAKGIDKGFGVRAVLKALGYIGRVVAVGDSDNDLPMFDVAEYTAAPSNASAQVKARANFVSRSSATIGLIDVLEHL